jgi:hypothetical protein
VAQVKQLRTELQTAMTDSKAQRSENERLRQREAAIDQRISTALETERANLRRDQERLASDRQQAEGLLEDIQRRLESIGSRGEHADLPVGLGLREGDAEGMPGTGIAGMRWVEPDDARASDARSGAGAQLSFPTRFGPAQRTLDNTIETVADAGTRVVRQPVWWARRARTAPRRSIRAEQLHPDGVGRHDRAHWPGGRSTGR